MRCYTHKYLIYLTVSMLQVEFSIIRNLTQLKRGRGFVTAIVLSVFCELTFNLSVCVCVCVCVRVCVTSR